MAAISPLIIFLSRASVRSRHGISIEDLHTVHSVRMYRRLERFGNSGVSTQRGPESSALNKELCVWLARFTGMLPRINVSGLALPHAVCLEDSDKWLDYETCSGER